MPSTRRQLLAGLIAAAPFFSAWAQGGAPLRVIVPYPAGGVTDQMARVVGDAMAGVLGQPVLIDNRPGAGSRIGIEAAARSPADGSTLLAINTSLAVMPVVDRKLPFDPLTSFAPVAPTGTYGLGIVVSNKTPAKTLAELIAYARKNPGRLSYGSSGVGTGAHFVGEYFKYLTGTHIVHIPYKSTSSALNDVAGGVLDMTFDATLNPYVSSGQIKLLAMVDSVHDPRFPDVPTTAEAGLKDFAMSSWLGFFAPAGTPAAAVDRLNAAVRSALQQPEVRRRLQSLGITPLDGSPADLKALLVKDMKLHRSIFELTKMKLED